MEIVKPTKNLEPLNRNVKDDFYIVPNLKFDVDKMRADLNVVLKKKKVQYSRNKKFRSYSLKSNSGRHILDRGSQCQRNILDYT